ncbi:MAG: endonuclease/exonuclease/phosphatase family protein [Pseudonocardiaceae bacterium]
MPSLNDELSPRPLAEPRHLASETQLRVVTWNVQHASPARSRNQAAWLADCEYADVAVLTEVGHGPGATALLRALGDHGFHMVCVPPPATRDYTTVIATRTPNVEAVPVPVDVLPHRISAARVMVGGRSATVIGLYVPSRGSAERRNVDKRAFQDSVTEALPRLAVEARGPLVITGDLNVVEPGHQPHYAVFGDWEYSFYRSFIDTGLVDAFRTLHPHDIEHSWYGRAGTGYRFDHTFLSTDHQWQLVDCRYLHSPRFDGLSDHSAMATIIAMWTPT